MLTDKAIKSAKPQVKPYKLSDGQGLYLYVTPNGSKSWRMKYRFQGKEKKLTLGLYPEFSATAAREWLATNRKLLRDDADPAAARKEARRPSAGTRFEIVAGEWLEQGAVRWAKQTHAMRKKRFEVYVYPFLGSRGIKSIEAPDILEMARAIEAKGTYETAHKVLQMVSQVFRYAIASGQAARNPAADLAGALKTIDAKPQAHLQAKDLPDFLKAVANYRGDLLTRCAIQFLALTFVRTSEMRFATWEEFDFKEKVWRIPAERMKMRRPHIVPLSKQALAILEIVKKINGRVQFVFANPTSRIKPLSENAVLYGIYRLGYKGRCTGHGFRHTASTILHENSFPTLVIERQLAHVDRDSVRATYNYAEYLPERKKMLQWWADYLDDRLRAAKH